MAINVKDLGASSQKWSTRAGAAASEFAANAQAAADVWARNTQAAMDNFRAGISAGNIAQRFSRGVARAASMNKFSRKLAAVGAGRYSEGVSQATDDWRAGFEPYQSTLQALSLPPRRPRGDAANIERVRAVTTAMHAKRIAGLGT